MLRRSLLLAAGGMVPIGGAGHARAQANVTPDLTPRLPSQPGQGPALEDVRALQRAARLTKSQAEAGQLAAGKASDPRVRELGQAVASAHGRFRQTAEDLARARRVELPPGPAEDRSLAPLQEAGGTAFDRAFLARQIGLYPVMAELFQTMASNSPDQDLSRFGITVLATVRAQFETARGLGAPMGLSVETVENPPQY